MEIHRTAAPADLTLYLDSSFDKVGSAFSSLQFGPLTAATDYTDERVNNNSATPYTLVSTANVAVNGSKFTYDGTAADWSNSVYSEEGYVGTAHLSFKVLQNDSTFMFGLHTDPAAENGHLFLKYVLYFYGAGNCVPWSESQSMGGVISYSIGDIFLFTYDNIRWRIYQNGVLVHTQSVPAGMKLYIDSSFGPGVTSLGSISYGPYSSADYGGLGNIPERFGDTASEGLNLTPTHLGYHNGTDWRAYIDNNGEFYFGDGEEEYIQFKTGELTLGDETRLRSVDTYNNNGSVFLNHIVQSSGEGLRTSQGYVYEAANAKLTGDTLCWAEYEIYSQIYSPALDTLTFDNTIHCKTRIRTLNLTTDNGNVFFGSGSFQSNFSVFYSGLGFHLSDDGKIYAVAISLAGNATGLVITDTGLTWANNTFYKLEYKYYPLDRIEYYVDDVLVATQAITAAPSDSRLTADFRFDVTSDSGTGFAVYKQVKLTFY